MTTHEGDIDHEAVMNHRFGTIGLLMDIIMFSKETVLSAEWKYQAHRHSHVGLRTQYIMCLVLSTRKEHITVHIYCICSCYNFEKQN